MTIHFNYYNKNIQQQQNLLYICLSNFIKKGTKVALLDFPNHNNVGDNAIWLGEKAALKKLGIDIVYQCDIYGYSEKALRKNLPKNGVVLLHGGGNLGSVWPEHQNFRETIIESLSDLRIIQLPQSVYFKHEEGLYQFIKIANAHPNLDILVRDRASLKVFENSRLNIHLCPDLAFALGSINQVNRPVVDAIWLARTDHESIGQKRVPADFTCERLDWLMGEPGRFYSKFSPKITVRIRRMVQSIFKKSKFVRDHLWKLNVATFDLIAKRRLRRGIRILCRGKIVITDRLHGHILSTLLGKPQVLFDNHYRKIGNYLDCFEGACKAVIYDPDGAIALESKVKKSLAIENSFEKIKK